MKKTIYEQDFIQEFADYNRADQFSRQALSLIFNHLEEYDENYELDVIEICGDYSEVPLLQFIEDYDLNIEDFLDEIDYEEDEINYDNYLKPISELIIDLLDNYIGYKILSERLLKKDDGTQYKILLASIYENDIWKEETTIYFITDTNYKFKNIAKTNQEAIEIGNNLDFTESCVDINKQSETKKELSWEDVDEDKLEEIISDYINDRGCLVGFTNQGTVVFQDF